MKYKKIDMTSFNLHIIKTKRFKTINFRVCLRDKIKKEEITLRNALTSFLTYSTNTYRTKRDLVLKAQDLYAVNVYTKSYRSGRFNMINFCMSLLNEKYGIKETDFLSSELEIVPAFKARSLGFDKSMVAAYGQDDKVCSYCNLEAILNTQNPEKTCVTILADKEEIGSVGNTGMCSETFDMFINELLNKKDEKDISTS